MINATYKPDSRDPEPLLELWEAGAWADLLRLSEAALKSGAANSPILPIYGAALCESGRQDEGLDTMVRFLKEFARGWTVNYRGLAFFYLALEKARSGDMNAGAEILARSFQDLPKERVANAITALGLPRPKPIVLWEGNQVPGDYELSSLDSPPVTATMSEELARLPEGSIFLLCLLGNYRGNGPYNQFMAQYRGYVRDFAPFVGPLHVITEMRDRYAERPHYFEEEDKALAEKAPFRILFDPEGEQGTAFGPSVSPFVMALDRTGRVLVEGEMEGMDLWRALLSANS
jgi:hypothetical protein